MEEFEQDPIIYTPLVSTKAKYEVLDPTGVVTETHEFEFKAAYWAGRGVLTMGKHQWMITGNGEYIRRIGEKPPEDNTHVMTFVVPPCTPSFIEKARHWLELRQAYFKKKQ